MHTARSNRSLVAAVLIALVVGALVGPRLEGWARTWNLPPEPEVLDWVHLAQPDGSYLPLEVQYWRNPGALLGMGVDPLTGARPQPANVPSSASGVRTGANPRFVVQPLNRFYVSFTLLRLDSDPVVSCRIRPDRAEESQIPLRVTRFGKDSFALTPVSELEPGEYCLAASGAFMGVANTYFFGVDPR